MHPSSTCSYGVGYVDVQCISANGVPSERTLCTVRSISSGVDMPVEMIIGLCLRAMWSWSGRVLGSPDPRFNARTPPGFGKDAAPRRKGAGKKTLSHVPALLPGG